MKIASLQAKLSYAKLLLACVIFNGPIKKWYQSFPLTLSETSESVYFIRRENRLMIVSKQC